MKHKCPFCNVQKKRGNICIRFTNDNYLKVCPHGGDWALCLDGEGGLEPEGGVGSEDGGGGRGDASPS